MISEFLLYLACNIIPIPACMQQTQQLMNKAIIFIVWHGKPNRPPFTDYLANCRLFLSKPLPLCSCRPLAHK